MQFVIDNDRLRSVLDVIVPIIDAKCPELIYGNVLIRARDNELTFVGKNLSMEIFATVANKIQKSGSATIPAKKLHALSAALPANSKIKCSITKEGQFLMQCEKRRYKLATMSAEEFPEFEVVRVDTQIKMDKKKFLKLLSNVAFAMAQDDARFFLNGMLIEVEDSEIRAIATNGHRLSIAKDTINANGKSRSIIPYLAVRQMHRLLKGGCDMVDIDIGERHIRCTCNGMTFSSLLIEAMFPDYQSAIPAETKSSFSTSRQDLLGMLSRALILADNKMRKIVVAVNGSFMQIMASNKDQEQSFEQIEIKYEGVEMGSCGYDARYIVDALNSIDSDECHGMFAEDRNVLIFVDGDAKHVIMPMIN